MKPRRLHAAQASMFAGEVIGSRHLVPFAVVPAGELHLQNPGGLRQESERSQGFLLGVHASWEPDLTPDEPEPSPCDDCPASGSQACQYCPAYEVGR
jgi:hypothetical protein